MNLTGGTLIAFIARGSGTVLASGLLGATPVGYRSRDRGDTWESWPPGLHARGFGERGSTLYVAADDANDGFALASSEDDGDSWTPRLRFAEIESVRSCTQRECLVDCWQKVTQGLFPPPVCGQAPPTEPPGDGGPAAAATPGDGGCGACATARTSDASRSFCVAAIAIAGGVVVARHPRKRRRRRAPLALLAVALTAAVVAGPRPALGYVRLQTKAGVPYWLASPCIPITVHLAGFPGVSDDDMRAAVTGAARAWTAETNPCTNLAIAIVFADGVGPPAGDDGTNIIGARADGWCRETIEPSPAGAGTCNAPSATAATSVFATADGRITGADIDLNTLTFAWSALDSQANPADRQYLQSVLTHEIGHLIGLDHACWSGIGDHATDDHGDPVPDCYAAPAAIKADTMFPTN